MLRRSLLNSNITKDNLSAEIFNVQTTAVSDLNSIPFGTSAYRPTTANIPYANTYGIVYYYQASTWLYQEAFDTTGNIYVRRKINAEDWTNWDRVIREPILNTALKTIIYSNSFLTQDSFTIYVNANLTGISITVNEPVQKSLTGRSGWTNVTSLPTELRPSRNIYASLFTPDSVISFATIMIMPSGALSYQPHTVSNAWLQGAASMIIA